MHKLKIVHIIFSKHCTTQRCIMQYDRTQTTAAGRYQTEMNYYQ
jgi:muramidase (phage lysozyme)